MKNSTKKITVIIAGIVLCTSVLVGGIFIANTGAKPSNQTIVSKNVNNADEPTDKKISLPTEISTQAPTQAPTVATTPVIIETPTQAPTQAPTVATTPVIIETPTQAPTQAPTVATTPVIIETPTQAPTQAPTVATTPVIVETPTQAPTQIPTKTTTQPSTSKDFVFIAYGKTSYGYDWTYSMDKVGIVARPDVKYDFNTNMYTFTFKGLSAGTVNVDIVYYTSDNTKVTVPTTMNVDNNCNIAVIYK